MRGIAVGACVAVCAVACGSQPAQAPTTQSTTTPAAATINPARIDRVRHDLPAGYESGVLDQRATPISLWGLRSEWVAEPEQCAELAAPGVDPATSRGWSASGPGGIVYAAVARVTAPPDSALAGQCGQWSINGGRTSGEVTALDAPAIDAAITTGMAAELTTVVEGGTETHTHADTFTADLGDYHCYVTVVTDPGSPNPALGADVAADLLVKTVSALRG
ncbi:hypothetical protein MMAG44476_26419 [Mycolicibacterium mageritense DSM 44476 = CIP 104973]|uniref:DUF5642 domain-containing protein n=1 Tax=Mycolicibacterium mageritense TaxID=53462 RepID=A0ABN5Y0B3_MYCME|nr:DUF5642 family protein [Mycolicibacterium mageritense]MCC9181917.1 DUF5642 family protein [Mycolicibacterium mageritense]BBX31478.1 hypothetical protein MMAGJ_07600 [Mycolicibacterium mageritense]